MGLGLANVLAGLDEGIRSFDSCLAGLGGCPFAPGASGNVVTEDLVFMLESMGYATGVDLRKLLEARALLAQALPERRCAAAWRLREFPGHSGGWRPRPGAARAGPVMDRRNGAEILLDTLIECGIDTLFGYPGGAALPLYDALYSRPALRHVLVRHEQAAVHAAEGYARSTGRVGVVLVTSGPGVGNTITGLLDAMSDSIPSPVHQRTGGKRRDRHQCFSGKRCAGHVASRHEMEPPAPTRAGRGAGRAARARGRRLGAPRTGAARHPQGRATRCGRQRHAFRGRDSCETIARSAPPAGSLQRAADLLAAAQRPVLYGGGGLINSGLQACRRSRNWPACWTHRPP